MVMQQAAEHRIPHWSGRWSPDGEHRAAPRQAGGGMDGHGPRRGGVKMALHLGYEPTIRVNVDAQRLADCREHATRKADINDGATHRDYAAGGGSPLRTFMTVRSHLVSYIPPGRAAGH